MFSALSFLFPSLFLFLSPVEYDWQIAIEQNNIGRIEQKRKPIVAEHFQFSPAQPNT